MDQFIEVAGTEGKVGGYFCRLPHLNENTVQVKTPYDKLVKMYAKYFGHITQMPSCPYMVKTI